VYEVTDQWPDFVHMGWLTMDAPELDLDLLYYNGTMWVVVMVSSGEVQMLSASYEGDIGMYAWRIRCDNCSADSDVMYSLAHVLPTVNAAEPGDLMCTRCEDCCDCSAAHVCYQCGPDDITVTDYQCYPNASVAVPVAVCFTLSVLVILAIWNAVKTRQYKSDPSQRMLASMRHARMASAVVLALGAVVFLTLGVVWHPIMGVDQNCDDCVTMDNTFWALFALNTIGVLVFAWLLRSDKSSQGQIQSDHDQHYVTLAN